MYLVTEAILAYKEGRKFLPVEVGFIEFKCSTMEILPEKKYKNKQKYI